MNPFEKRATEYLRDDEAFLAFVTPEPLITFFSKFAKEDRLYDRLAVVIGTPGSGKTTLAKLFSFSTITTLLKNKNLENSASLIDALTTCGAIKEEFPSIAASRLPLETEYREFWEFPYPDDLKFNLMITLLQARTMISWLKNLVSGGVSLAEIKIIPRNDANAALEAIGGSAGPDLMSRAKEVEQAIYNISAALIPPAIEKIDFDSIGSYRPFDVIEKFSFTDLDNTIELKPLAIFDDAHSLHPNQFKMLQKWLARRELKMARWILTRLDALAPKEALLGQSESEDLDPGLKPSREITFIWFQSTNDRGKQRKDFRKMAKDMANRYLRQMETFNRRGLVSLADILSTNPEPIPPSKYEELLEKVKTYQRRYKISQAAVKEMVKNISDYSASSSDVDKDMQLALQKILLSRYAKRIPQRALFDDEDAELSLERMPSADSSVLDGAKIHLMHDYNKPYFYGIDTLCDASSENAEQFLQLASVLVSQAETLIIRGKPPSISSGAQHKLLQRKAKDIIALWDFPHHHAVKKLADNIAKECVARSREENAPLGGGAIAVGIPQDEFDIITKSYPRLSEVLQFGVAYNAFTLIHNYSVKNRQWCLIELGGMMLLKYGLTLKRGGLLEKNLQDLNNLCIKGDDA